MPPNPLSFDGQTLQSLSGNKRSRSWFLAAVGGVALLAAVGVLVAVAAFGPGNGIQTFPVAVPPSGNDNDAIAVFSPTPNSHYVANAEFRASSSTHQHSGAVRHSNTHQHACSSSGIAGYTNPFSPSNADTKTCDGNTHPDANACSNTHPA